MSNENKKKLERKRFKKVLASRALTSTVVLSSLVSVATLIAANGSVYNPVQRSNGIIQDNLKGKNAVNEAAHILNHQATSVPASGAANRFDGLTSYKNSIDHKGIGKDIIHHNAWGDKNDADFKAFMAAKNGVSVAEYLKYVKLSAKGYVGDAMTGTDPKVAWTQRFLLAAVTGDGSGWCSDMTNGKWFFDTAAKADVEQTRIRNKYGWQPHSTWTSTANYASDGTHRLDVTELDMGNGWKLGVAVQSYLTNHGGTYHLTIDDYRLTLMNDASATVKVEFKADDTNAVGSDSPTRFDDSTEIHDTHVTTTTHMGLVGQVATPAADNPVTSSAKAKAKYGAWYAQIAGTATKVAHSAYANKLVVSDAQATELLKRENHNAFFKLPDDFKVADKKIQLVKANGDKVIDITLSDEEVEKINSRLDASFAAGHSESWVQLNWDSSSTNYIYKYTASGKNKALEDNKPAGIRDEKKSILTWKTSFYKTNWQANATSNAASLASNLGLENEFVRVGSSVTATPFDEQIEFSGTTSSETPITNNWGFKWTDAPIAEMNPSHASTQGTWAQAQTQANPFISWDPNNVSTGDAHNGARNGSWADIGNTNGGIKTHDGASIGRVKLVDDQKKGGTGQDAELLKLDGNAAAMDRLAYIDVHMVYSVSTGHNGSAYTGIKAMSFKMRLYWDNSRKTFPQWELLHKGGERPGGALAAFNTRNTTTFDSYSNHFRFNLNGAEIGAKWYIPTNITAANKGFIWVKPTQNTTSKPKYGFWSVNEVSAHYKGNHVYTVNSADADKKITKNTNFGNNLPTDLPSGIQAHYTYKRYRIDATTASNAQYILGVDTKGSQGIATNGTKGPIPEDILYEGFVDKSTDGWTPTTVANLTQTATKYLNYDATTTKANTKIIHYIDGDALLAAAGMAVTYRNGMLLISTSFHS